MQLRDHVGKVVISKSILKYNSANTPYKRGMTQITIQISMSPRFISDKFVKTRFPWGKCMSQAEAECRFPAFNKELPFSDLQT